MSGANYYLEEFKARMDFSFHPKIGIVLLNSQESLFFALRFEVADIVVKEQARGLSYPTGVCFIKGLANPTRLPVYLCGAVWLENFGQVSEPRLAFGFAPPDLSEEETRLVMRSLAKLIGSTFVS